MDLVIAISQGLGLAAAAGLLAAALMDDGLRMHELPFESAPFNWMMYWHRRYDQSNANIWLREQVRQVCAARR